MPYALVPKDYTLKKVTTQQRAAVDAQRSHENVMALIDNPEIIKQLIIVATGYLALKEAQDIWEWLDQQGIKIKQEVKDDYTKKRSIPGAPVGVSIENLIKAFPDEISKRVPFL